MKESYTSIVQLIERLHRHFLDVLRTELRRLGIDDINAVQALLLANIGEEDVVIRDLKDRGYYHGSNVSYNIKKLTEMEYIHQERDAHDRRAVRLRLSPKGLDLCDRIRELQNHLTQSLEKTGASTPALNGAIDALHSVERVWTDYIRYGRR
ncbi:MarR family winged helix-turn-helix transcriptional regulator [Novispirillum sp. DQ9]|uniref:MarR family winged helix-turn-helix transcriptional regulator n=1 Tax=Novispirillum sp. DQ9 TaxID=3398612 RepID=UPI003C7BAA36